MQRRLKRHDSQRCSFALRVQFLGQSSRPGCLRPTRHSETHSKSSVPAFLRCATRSRTSCSRNGFGSNAGSAAHRRVRCRAISLTSLPSARAGKQSKAICSISSARLPSADLDRVVEYHNTKGHAFSNPMWQMLQHLVNHGTYHRGQITTMLRQLGATPLTTDLIAFYREQAGLAHN